MGLLGIYGVPTLTPCVRNVCVNEAARVLFCWTPRNVVFAFRPTLFPEFVWRWYSRH